MTREQYHQTPAGERFLYPFMRHPLAILFGYITVRHTRRLHQTVQFHFLLRRSRPLLNITVAIE